LFERKLYFKPTSHMYVLNEKEIPQHEFLAKNVGTFQGGGGTFEEVREESFTQ
jgi:hypothetical protein